jgi:mRNA interferase HigB
LYKQKTKVVIIAKRAINEFCRAHADSRQALNNWYETTLQADWSNMTELKADFPSADYVGDNRFVFNIKGNHYRLVALIFFSIRTVYIKFIGTHAGYDKIDAETVDDY